MVLLSWENWKILYAIEKLIFTLWFCTLDRRKNEQLMLRIFWIGWQSSAVIVSEFLFFKVFSFPMSRLFSSSRSPSASSRRSPASDRFESLSQSGPPATSRLGQSSPVPFTQLSHSAGEYDGGGCRSVIVTMFRVRVFLLYMSRLRFVVVWLVGRVISSVSAVLTYVV